MNNKKIVERYIECYNTGDNAKILSCLAEDVIFELVGFFNLKGKDQFEKEINNEAADGNPTITITQLVEECNIVVAEGTVKGKLKNGGIMDALFCEVFHFDNGKVKKLTTYHIEKKAQII
jgi:ketosteroid isomerase-like protein